jgi:hypothetical protein
MANRYLGFIGIIQFAAAMAIVLSTATGWAQSEGQATFTPIIHQKLETRSVPAKVTSEEESALTSKGYVQIGTISASQAGSSAQPTNGLRQLTGPSKKS